LIRNRLGVPGILAVIALVFSMAGGAYAAKKYIITSTSQIKPSVLKKLRGPAGPPGATGATGATGQGGSAGQNGADGKTGTNGTNGKSVVTGSEASGTANCEGRGGAWVEVEGSNQKRYICNGESGAPSSGTMTGEWSFDTKGAASTLVSFSFPRELSAEPAFNWMGSGATPTPACPGSPANPEAAPGNVCMYAVGMFHAGEGTDQHPQGYVSPASPGSYNGYTVAPKSGVTVEFPVEAGEEAYGWGSWAATP
jgi:hypothetical protein